MNDRESLARVAELLGRLLLRELDAGQLAELAREEARAALSGVGISVPEVSEESLEELGEEFFRLFLDTRAFPPLVQSVVEEGRYDGTAARVVRQIAEAAGFEFASSNSRGATLDSLAALLLLWAQQVVRDPPGAERFAENHLRWALHPLRSRAGGGGFYASVCRVTGSFLEAILVEEAESASQGGSAAAP